LHPKAKCGVTFSRSSWSSMPFSMLASACFCAGAEIFGHSVNAGTVTSFDQYTPAR
jgi:hypothetical protein